MNDKAIKIGKGDALVIVDGQNDFIRKNGALYVAGVKGESSNRTIIRQIIVLGQKQFDYLITTEDFHPQEQHIEFKIFGPHCVWGTLGQRYHDDLLALYRNAHQNLTKGQNPDFISYSVASSPDFASCIRDLRLFRIKRIFFAGWAYTHCVGESAIAFAMQGFEAYVIRDCTRSVPPPYGDPVAMEQKLRLYGVKQVLFRDIE